MFGLQLWRRAKLLVGTKVGRKIADENQLALWQHAADALLKDGRHVEARILYEKILSVVPDDLYVIFRLATALEHIGDLGAAVVACDRGLALAPDQPGLLSRRASIARLGQQFVLALSLYDRLKSLHPEFPFVDAHIADQLAHLGRGHEAIEAIDRALIANPENVRIQSDRLYMLNYFGILSRDQLFEEHRRWGAMHETALRSRWPVHAQSRDPERRLRIGYVSPDLRRHAVAYFIEGVLRSHDKQQFDMLCLDVSPYAEDAVTRRLRGYVEQWHRLGMASDEELASFICRKQIDILIDLSGHTAHNRLLVFARRPAPVQVSWFGYMNTTGLKTMDYRLTDSSLDPPGGRSDAFYTERLFRVPSTVCFQPDAESPDVASLPALRSGVVTLASLNQWTKVSDVAKDVWARVLASSASTRLVVVARGGDDLAVQSKIHEEFTRRGVQQDRVEVIGFRPIKAFLALLNTIDFALDPFPYGGGTTTLHCAWMGVPIVTLEGEAELGRGTPGILRALGLHEIVARNVDEYHKIALALAADLPRLATYRADLRERLRRSPLLDAVGLTRAVEAAYRTMWRAYCSSVTDTDDAEQRQLSRSRTS